MRRLRPSLPSSALVRPSFPSRRLPAAIGLALLCLTGTALAAPQQAAPAAGDASATDLDKVLVVGQRANRVSNGATNLDLAIKETPQSISVVSSEQMAQFGADSLNDALRLATGIQVEEWETNRTNYLARGFEIKSTQVDGVGMPNDWGIATGAMDAFGYEKLEVIRGANGLLTGVGNSAGTINYVRKRPTNDAEGSVGVKVGSWGERRVEFDYSTPFTDNGTWAGRVVVAREEADSYLRDFESERTFGYAVIDGQVGDDGTLTFGYSWQQADTTGNMWGALPFVNTDGTQPSWDVGASTTVDWAYWDTNTQAAFVEYTHQLGEDWQLKATYNHRKGENDDQLFFAYSFAGLDPVTRTGLLGWAYKGQDELTSDLVDLSLNGRFQLFGREHEAMFGLSQAESEQTYSFNPSLSVFDPLPAFPYAGDAVPEPTWGPRERSSFFNQRLRRVFGATRLSLTEDFKAVLGVNYAEYHRDGANGIEPFDETESNTSPYAGLTYDFTDDLLGYVSYSDIYQPQDQRDFDGFYLAPSKGVNYEVGVKAEWLDKRLLTTLAYFTAKQEGLATFAGYNADTLLNYYVPKDVESKGWEFEATGRLNAYTDLVFGYTHLKMDGEEGTLTYNWVPRRTANLMLSARLPSYEALSFGIGGRWQSAISNTESYSGQTVRQGSYAVVNAFAAWNFLENATLRANVGNLTDEKYINTLYQIGYYGAPRHWSLSLEYRF
ncbi:TonB-dependent siderophore receptor [Pseudoxanthomonas sp. LH2527]|uniref:TonB-dependent siderophore receptor n=1 Tax=Pseudoxanthomonas sp. LH2527 TaxID=2923249 RepID=UPI001F136390|nr:TonB-dependent siderophore receptor [Pseudoxanthomonas sp. LH2527]MCH6482853.1 TonB-dependent siderophore receptor [Pseudoxanthomonas sp. LH2527]